MPSEISRSKIEKIVSENQFINSEQNVQRIPLYREQTLLANIRDGNYQDIVFLNFSQLEGHVGKSAPNKKKYEYYAVCAIALGSRAAIKGGLPEDLAFDISDALLEKLSSLSEMEEIHQLTVQGLSLLAYQVFLHKRNPESYLVEQVKNYVSQNVFRKIYLKDIAAHIDVSPAYLSHLFSEKAGISIQKYIQQEKVGRACNLLKYSNSSVAEIAQYLSYQSQSHFSGIFKQFTGQTPLQYRNTHKTSAFD